MKKDAAIYTITSVLSAALSLPTVLFLTRILSPAEFGKAMLYTTLISLVFSLCNLGMDQVFARFYYEKHSYKEKISLLVTNLFVVTIAFFLLALLLTPFKAKLMQYLFHMNSWLVFIWIWLGAYLYGLQRFFLLTFRMAQKSLAYGMGNLVGQLALLLSVLGIYYFFHLSNFNIGVYSQIISIGMVTFTLLFFMVRACRRRNIPISLKIDFKNIPHYCNYGYPFILSLSLFWLAQNMDKFALLHWSNFHELGIYSAAFVLASPLVFIQNIFTTMWVPIRNKGLCGDLEQAKNLFAEVFNKTFVWMTISMAAIILCKNVIVLILPMQYRVAVNTFSWLLFIPYFWALSEIVTAGIILSKKSYWNILISVFSLLANLVGCYFLIPAFGAQGAAMSIAVAYLVFFLLRWIIAFAYLRFEIPKVSLFLAILSCSIVIISYAYWWIIVILSVLLLRKKIQIIFEKIPKLL